MRSLVPTDRSRSSWHSRPLSRIAFPAIGVAMLVVLAPAPPALGKRKPPVSKVVTGQVLDRDENGVEGAVVELTDLQTHRKIAITSENDGRYQFSDLSPAHDYELQAKYKGAASEIKRVTSFDSRLRIVLNLKIQPAQAGPPPK